MTKLTVYFRNFANAPKRGLPDTNKSSNSAVFRSVPNNTITVDSTSSRQAILHIYHFVWGSVVLRKNDNVHSTRGKEIYCACHPLFSVDG